jgi:hypothetical protein
MAREFKGTIALDVCDEVHLDVERDFAAAMARD